MSVSSFSPQEESTDEEHRKTMYSIGKARRRHRADKTENKAP